MLEYITFRYLLLDSLSNAWPVKMLTNNCLRSIQSCMMEIQVVPFYYVSLEFPWNYYFILVRYEFYSILVSAKITLFIFCAFKFSVTKGSSR